MAFLFMELPQGLRVKVYEYALAPHSSVVRFSLGLDDKLHGYSQRYPDRLTLSLFLAQPQELHYLEA